LPDVPAAQTLDGFHIIFVDDDQLVRDFAVHTIEYGTNRKVATFDSGFEAWQFIQRTPQAGDLIIVDANIPDMDGLELLRRVKQEHPEKKLVLTTSNPSLEVEAGQLGADALLSKPYDTKDLFAVVQRFYAEAVQSQQNKVALFPGNGETPPAEKG
jgi:CheY-like chemotaxis protein